jgi:hypothetical protein
MTVRILFTAKQMKILKILAWDLAQKSRLMDPPKIQKISAIAADVNYAYVELKY